MAVVVADPLGNSVFGASLFELNYETLPAQLLRERGVGPTGGPDEKDGPIRHGSYQPDHVVKLDEEKLQDRRSTDDEPVGATRVSAQQTTPINAHCPIELSSTLAHWDGDVVLCAVWCRRCGAPGQGGVDQRPDVLLHRPRTEQHTLTETPTVAHVCETVGLCARFLSELPQLVPSHTVARVNLHTPCFMRGPMAPGLLALEVAMG
jgi:xanthine dehydrogenase YagR molybdenum-binding subunit